MMMRGIRQGCSLAATEGRPGYDAIITRTFFFALSAIGFHGDFSQRASPFYLLQGRNYDLMFAIRVAERCWDHKVHAPWSKRARKRRENVPSQAVRQGAFEKKNSRRDRD